MNLSLFWTLFKIYDSDVFYFILFKFMIKYFFLNNFVNTHGTRGYPRIWKK